MKSKNLIAMHLEMLFLLQIILKKLNYKMHKLKSTNLLELQKNLFKMKLNILPKMNQWISQMKLNYLKIIKKLFNMKF